MQSTLLSLPGDTCRQPETDVVALLLADKRSPATRRAYEGDLRDFFQGQPTPELVQAFLSLPTPELAAAMARYKSDLRSRGLASASVNRRLAALKSLLKFAHRLGLCASDGRNLCDGEKVVAYRDTRGVDVPTLRKLLAAPGLRYQTAPDVKNKKVEYIGNSPNSSEYVPDTTKAVATLRDLAILRLLIENALRRAELVKLDVEDFEAESKTLWILGKGKGSQKERVTLSPGLTASLGEYLAAAGHTSGALFRNLARDPACAGQRLTSDGLYQLVGGYGRMIGLKRLTPHQLRHSSITAALEATKGDVRRVRKLSRHAKLDTLLIYDDAREDMQGEVSGLLSGLMG